MKGQESTVERNKHAVRAAIKAWGDGDVETYAKAFAKELRWTVIGSTAVSGTYESRDALFARMAAVLNSVMESSLAPRLVDLIAERDMVVAILETSAKARNGVAYEQRYTWVMRLDNAIIVEGTAYMDTALVDAVTAGSTNG